MWGFRGFHWRSGRRLQSSRLAAFALFIALVGACGADGSEPVDETRLDEARGVALAAGIGPEGVDATWRWREVAVREGRALEVVHADRHLETLAQAPRAACLAGIAIARAKAREDPRGAYLDAYRTTEGAPDDDACRERARALLTELEAHRPPAGELARLVSGRVEACRISRVAVLGSGVFEGEAQGVRVLLFTEGDCALEGRAVGTRFVVDGPGATIDEAVPERMTVGSGGVVAVTRVVRSEAGRAPNPRIELELAEGASAQAFDLGSRFVVDVAVRSSIDERTDRAARLVVIDPGHGGLDFGARFDGLREAQVALDLAERAARIVARRLPSSRVVLTRTRDEIVPLEQRAAFANAVGADLFVSIHLNAADEPVRIGGVTTFVLDVTDDRQALRLAARENATAVSEVTGIQRLLARVHRADQVERSRRLAAHVHEATLEGGRRVLPDLPDRGVKSAMFYVLVGARMPAILLEASFLTKPEEAAALHTESYREALAAGIAEGIVRYVAELDATPTTP